MKLKLKEDPREWSKTARLSAVALAVFSTVLRWRKILPNGAWLALLAVLLLVAVLSTARPRWFRGYYRVSSALGFYLSQFIGRILLMIFFLVVLTPLGLILRLCGKDLLRLKKPRHAPTYWNKAKASSPPDRMF